MQKKRKNNQKRKETPKTATQLFPKAMQQSQHTQASQKAAPLPPVQRLGMRISRPIAFFWGGVVGLSVIVSLLLSVLYFRQEIAVDPGFSYSPSDPFSQRFVITNNGPFAIHEVHYTCAVTFLATGNPQADAVSNSYVPVMVPVTGHIPAIRWKEKTSTDCDFIARFGPELQSLRIDINVFYKRKFWFQNLHTLGAKFTARRDITGRFSWDYGSPDEGPFDGDYNPDINRGIVFVPFLTPEVIVADDQTLNSALDTVKDDIAQLTWIEKSKGYKHWAVEGIIPPNVPRFWKPNQGARQ